MVKILRNLVADKIRDDYQRDENLKSSVDGTLDEYNETLEQYLYGIKNEKKWADHIMIDITCNILNIFTVLINSVDHSIYPGILDNIFINQNAKIVIIWYQLDTHFENIRNIENEYPKYYFDGLDDFRTQNKNLFKKILKIENLKQYANWF